MATRSVLIVYILPVIASILFGFAVLSDVLQKPDRALGSWSVPDDASIQIIGLSEQYTTTEPVEIQVKVDGSSFNCGDLYVTIYSAGQRDIIAQDGFFDQCFESQSNIIPAMGQFSVIIDTPGSYELVTEMVSKQLKNISTKGTFIVK